MGLRIPGVGSGGSTSSAGGLVLLALLAWPTVRASGQALTVDTVGDALKIRAPAFSFLKEIRSLD